MLKLILNVQLDIDALSLNSFVASIISETLDMCATLEPVFDTESVCKSVSYGSESGTVQEATGAV